MVQPYRPLTYERLKEVIEYNPDTGEFFRLESYGVTNLYRPILSKSKTKLCISIDGNSYRASHLAIMYSTGELPSNRVYHKNYDHKDFRLSNLYEYSDRGCEVLTQSRLKEVLEYDPTNGYFFRIMPDGAILDKTPVGSVSDGYIVISVDARGHLAHRLVFLYEDGVFPEEGADVDHIDRCKSNNKRNNLRLVSRQCNIRNSPLRKNNTSGVIGVSSMRNKWQASITIGYKKKSLGTFDSFDDAVYCRWEGEKKYEFQNCNTTSSSYEYLKKNNLLKEIDKND